MNDVLILRKLARTYINMINPDKNAYLLNLHKSVNDLHMIRPVVMIHELPWHEMNFNGDLDLHCTDPIFRNFESFFRSNIFKMKYFPADSIFKPYVPVRKHVITTSMGVDVDENTISIDKGNHIISHEYHDKVSDDEALAKFSDVKVSVDMVKTMEVFNKIGEAIGDILPVKLTGIDHLYDATWDTISRYRGVNELLIDLMERPDFSHRVVKRFSEINFSIMKQYEELGLYDIDPDTLHCTPIATDDLPSKSYEGEKVLLKDIWGRGTAQIFATVSKAMHKEYDIDYMKNTVGQCGLVYYGCCEPLDNKLDVIEEIPNLRKVSVTPWANQEISAEGINKKYVFASKPNPAMVAVNNLDENVLKKEIKKILDATKANGCNIDITLKDISTCGKKPENIFKWEKIVMEMVNNY